MTSIDTRQAETRYERYRLQALSRGALVGTDHERLRLCGQVPAPTCSRVAVKISPDGVAYFSGLQRCGSVWSCPVCSPKIRHRRSLEVEEAVENWWAEGGQVVFVTATLRHQDGEELQDVWHALMGAWRRLQQGRSWDVFRCSSGMLGSVRVVEATHGRNGWHPHVHALFFVRDPEVVVRELPGRWMAALEREGRTGEVGVALDVRTVKAGDSEIGGYLAKTRAALELTRLDLKTKGRTPWALLAAGEVSLWREWVDASKGRRMIGWSRGIRERLLSDPVEATDEELAEEDLGGLVVAYLDAATFVGMSWQDRCCYLEACELRHGVTARAGPAA